MFFIYSGYKSSFVPHLELSGPSLFSHHVLLNFIHVQIQLLKWTVTDKLVPLLPRGLPEGER